MYYVNTVACAVIETCREYPDDAALLFSHVLVENDSKHVIDNPLEMDIVQATCRIATETSIWMVCELENAGSHDYREIWVQ